MSTPELPSGGASRPVAPDATAIVAAPGWPPRIRGALAARAGVIGVTGLALAIGLTLVGAVIAAWLASRGTLPGDRAGLLLVLAVGALGFAAVGTIVFVRLESNPVGPLMLLAGLLIGIQCAATGYITWDTADPANLPGAALAAAVLNPLPNVIVTLVIPRLLLVFPTGRLPSPRWRLVAALQFVLLLGIFVVTLMPGPLPDYPYANPLGIDALAGAHGLVDASIPVIVSLMFAVVVGACLSLVARFRHAGGVERQQLKWIAWVALIVAVAMAVAVLGALLWPSPAAGAAGAAASAMAIVAFCSLPIIVGLAVFRYRLFDIDRIISRTIGWATSTAILVGLFAIAELGLQVLLSGITGNETVIVAASTLLAAAAFQPLRRRVQAFVDRRFDRTRYDAESTLDGFVTRLRNELDLTTLHADLVATAVESVRPQSTGLWLRNRTAPRVAEPIPAGGHSHVGAFGKQRQ